MAVALIVEDDEVLRAAMARGLAKIEGLRVEEADTLKAALERLASVQPDVVLSDIDLPDGSGLEIVAHRDRGGRRCPIVFVTAYLSSYGHQIPARADVEIREKPLSLGQLREIVAEKVGSAAVKGHAGPFAVTDYVQLACMGRRSVSIELVDRDHRERGRIVIERGVLWAARDVEGHGEDAFRRLAFAHDAHPVVHSLTTDPGPREIQASWEHLLLESARLTDEESREPPAANAFADFEPASTADLQGFRTTGDIHPEPSVAESPRSTDLQPPMGTSDVFPERLPASIEELRDRALELILEGDLVAASRVILAEHAHGPSARTFANIDRLTDLGVPLDRR